MQPKFDVILSYDSSFNKNLNPEIEKEIVNRFQTYLNYPVPETKFALPELGQETIIEYRKKEYYFKIEEIIDKITEILVKVSLTSIKNR